MVNMQFGTLENAGGGEGGTQQICSLQTLPLRDESIQPAAHLWEG